MRRVRCTPNFCSCSWSCFPQVRLEDWWKLDGVLGPLPELPLVAALSGCDYACSVHGIGLKTARKLVAKCGDNLDRIVESPRGL